MLCGISFDRIKNSIFDFKSVGYGRIPNYGNGVTFDAMSLFVHLIRRY